MKAPKGSPQWYKDQSAAIRSALKDCYLIQVDEAVKAQCDARFVIQLRIKANPFLKWILIGALTSAGLMVGTMLVGLLKKKWAAEEQAARIAIQEICFPPRFSLLRK